jgi:hypothetical protein
VAHYYYIIVTSTGVCDRFSIIGMSEERRSLLSEDLNIGASERYANGSLVM